MSDSTCTVALDVGGSAIKVGAVDIDARCWLGTPIPIDHEAKATVLLDCFAEAFVIGRSLAPCATTQLAMAFPAPFDYRAGVSTMTHKFADLHQRSLRSALIERIGEPLTIRFVNDAAAAGIGEFHSSTEHGGRMLFITLGTGFGSALIDDRRVIDESSVGDLWQLKAPGGTADDVFSARGLATRLGSNMNELPGYLNTSDHRETDHLLDTFGSELGSFLAPVARSLHVDEVVIGGGLSAVFVRFAGALRAALPVPVRGSSLQNGAGVLGAGMHLLTEAAA